MLKRIISSILATTIALSTLVTTAYAVDANASGGGTGGVMGLSMDYYTTYQQGLRMYLVTPEGSIVGDVVDVAYYTAKYDTAEYNYGGELYLQYALAGGNISYRTKFGTISPERLLILSNATMSAYSGKKDWWTEILGNVPIGITHNGSNFKGNGVNVRNAFMSTSSNGKETILNIVGTEKKTSDPFSDIFNIASVGQKPADVMTQKGYRIVVEQLVWVRPSVAYSSSTGFAKDYLYYGTPEGVCELYQKDGINTTYYNSVATRGLASYSLGLSSATDRNKTIGDSYFLKGSVLPYNTIALAKAGAHTGNGLHIYFADIEPEGGTIDIWDNFRYKTEEVLDFVTADSGKTAKEVSKMASWNGIDEAKLSEIGEEALKAVSKLNSLNNVKTYVTSEKLQSLVPNLSKSNELALISATNTSNLSSLTTTDGVIYNHVSNQLSGLNYASASEYADLSGLTGIENMVAIPIELEKSIGGSAITSYPEVFSLYEINIEANLKKTDKI